MTGCSSLECRRPASVVVVLADVAQPSAGACRLCVACAQAAIVAELRWLSSGCHSLLVYPIAKIEKPPPPSAGGDTQPT